MEGANRLDWESIRDFFRTGQVHHRYLVNGLRRGLSAFLKQRRIDAWEPDIRAEELDLSDRKFIDKRYIGSQDLTERLHSTRTISRCQRIALLSWSRTRPWVMGFPRDKADRCPPGWHSHPDYDNGRCHPESQQHRTGVHHEEGGGQRGPRQDSQNEEERKVAALKRIEARGVKVEEREKAHPNVLENVDAGLEEATKYGASLPKIVRIDSNYAEKLGSILSIPATYGREDDVLYINPRSRFYQAGMLRARERMKRTGELPRFSTDSTLHFVRHEMSHCAHWHHDQKSYELDDFEDPSHKEVIRSQVSEYASEDPREFVAETRAALLDGKEFSDEIMKLYLHYSGGLTR